MNNTIRQQWHRQGEWENWGNVPPKPGQFAKDGEQPAPQPAVSLDSNRKFKFLLIFKIFLLKLSKPSKIFLKHFQNCQ